MRIINCPIIVAFAIDELENQFGKVSMLYMSEFPENQQWWIDDSIEEPDSEHFIWDEDLYEDPWSEYLGIIRWDHFYNGPDDCQEKPILGEYW